MTREEGMDLVKKTLNGEVEEAQFVSSISSISGDLAVNLVFTYGSEKSKGRLSEFYIEFTHKYPSFVENLRANIKGNHG